MLRRKLFVADLRRAGYSLPEFFRHVSALLRGQQPLFHGILQLLQAVSLPPGRDRPGLYFFIL